MSDIATIIVPDNDGETTDFDWLLCGPDLESDDSLRTAVIISLFSDRLANADDVLPSNDGDRRGWWGDLPIDSSAPGPDDYIGSRLWLLERCTNAPANAVAAAAYAKEALQWLIDDGVAQSVAVQAVWISSDQLGLIIIISQQSGNAQPVQKTFQFAWDATMAGGPVCTPANIEQQLQQTSFGH